MSCRLFDPQTNNSGSTGTRADFSPAAVRLGTNSVHLTLWMKMALKTPLRRDAVDSVRSIMTSSMFTESDEAEFFTWLLRRLLFSKCELRTCKHCLTADYYSCQPHWQFESHRTWIKLCLSMMPTMTAPRSASKPGTCKRSMMR